MKQIFFHPEFASELEIVSPAARTQFFLYVIEQTSSLPQTLFPLSYQPPRSFLNFSYNLFFQRMLEAEDYISCKIREGENNMVYLHLTFAGTDDHLTRTTTGRRKDVQAGTVTAMPLEDVTALYPLEYEQALSLHQIREQQELNRELVKLSRAQARKDQAELFYHSPSYLNCFERRIDYYFTSLTRHLNSHGGSFKMEISMPGSEDLKFTSLQELEKQITERL